MPEAAIFISYRRDDAAGYARAVYDALAREFGAERVFIDVDDIDAGQTFAEVIQQAVGHSKVLLVLIGKRWLGVRDGMPPRIHDSGDFVRLEVAAALKRGMRVIPVLLDNAELPSAAQLPEDLRALLQRNALELRNTGFAADIDRLAGALRESVGSGAPAPPPAAAAAPATRKPARALVLGLGAAAVLLIAAGAALWQQRATPGMAGGARAAINGVWQAEVDYDWPNAHYTERFEFGGVGRELHGSASFLRVPRGVLEGSADAEGLQFVTRSAEVSSGAAQDSVHRYRARLMGDELRVVMQTEGGSSAHVAVEFVARRAGPAAASAAR